MKQADSNQQRVCRRRKKNGERQRVTDMFISLVAAGADPEWVAERMRVSMFTTVYDAMIKRKHDEWERCRFEAILPAMAAGAKIKWEDFKNPYKIEEKQKDATADEIKAARQRLKQLKNGRK